MSLLLMALLAQDPAPAQADASQPESSEERASEADASSAEESSPVEESATEPEEDVTGEEGSGSAEEGPAPTPDPIERPEICSRESTARGASLYAEDNNRWNTHQVGDLVTVQVFDALQTEVSAATDTDRSSNQESKVGALLGLVSQVLIANPTMELESGEVGVQAETASTFSGNGSTSRENAVATTLTCTVVEVLPGGNLRIEGSKQVLVNGETQTVVLHGVARPEDIRGDNTISSDRLADSQIQVSGQGVVDDRQRPGWGTRVLDRAWPF